MVLTKTQQKKINNTCREFFRKLKADTDKVKEENIKQGGKELWKKS